MFLDNKAFTKDEGTNKKKSFYSPIKKQEKISRYNPNKNTPQQIVSQEKNKKEILSLKPIDKKVLGSIKNQPKFKFDDIEDSWKYAMQPTKKIVDLKTIDDS